MKTARADEARAVKLSLILENGVYVPKNSEGRKQRQQKSESVKLSRDVREIDFEKFSLPNDGRKRKRLSRDRQAAAGWLATFGDGDGSRIFPGLKKMARHFGWSERKCDYVIADLKTLGILIPSTAKRDGQHGNKQWEMIPSALNVEAQDSQIVEAQDSILEAQNRNVDPQDRHVEAQNTMLRPTVTDRHLNPTVTVPSPRFERTQPVLSNLVQLQNSQSDALPPNRSDNHLILAAQTYIADRIRLAHGRAIALWSVINYLREHFDLTSARAEEIANAACAHFPHASFKRSAPVPAPKSKAAN
jgi:hypothetical protein